MQCDYFDAGRCRSCTLMGSAYVDQLAAKSAAVLETLGAHAAGTTWLEPVRSAESHFRNKAKLVVGGRARNPTLGILDSAGHGVDLRRCGLYEPGLAATFDPLHDVLAAIGLEPYDVPRRRGELKHVLVTHSPDGEHLVRFVVRSEASVERLRAALPRIRDAVPSARVVSANVLPEHKAVLEGEREVVLTEQTLLPMRVNGIELLLGPRAFFQTNTRVAAELYRQVRTWADAGAPRTVWDLYCGVGGFALHLAGAGRHVVGVETSAEAVDAARSAAGRLPPEATAGGIEFIAGDATRDIPSATADLVVVNPPRRGLGPQLAGWLDDSAASHLVYSSCNVESLARDLAAMPAWHPVEGRVVDMFPQSRHVETVLLLRRHR
jgi:23S rRNA (uracil747-C5)-methyltransferase